MIDPHYKKTGQARVDDFEKYIFNARKAANLIDEAIETSYIYREDELWQGVKTLRKIADGLEGDLKNGTH